jgi:hypothetical protein
VIACFLRVGLASLALCLTPATLRAAPSIGDDSQSQVFSTSTYIAEIDRLIAALQAASDAHAGAEIAATVPARWQVAAGDQHVNVPAAWLKEALSGAPAQANTWRTLRSTLQRRLERLRDEAAGIDDRSAGDRRARARAAVQPILDRPEFQQSASSRLREQISERLTNWLESLLQRFGGGPAARRRVAIIFAWAIAIGALAALAVWLARALADRSSGASLSLAGGDSSRPRARELALRALAEARAHNLREAVRYGYHAALIRLEEDGVWRVDESRTPREYLRILATSDARRGLMMDLTQRFEQIWYGNRAVLDDDVTRVAASLETLGCLRSGDRAI